MRTLLAPLAALGLWTGGASAANGLLGHPDQSWIALSGTVQSVQDGSFTLDYGQGAVTVQVGDWSRFGDLRERLSGKQASVHGEVDDDLFGATRLEAESIYVKDLHTYFFAQRHDAAIVWLDVTEPGTDPDATLRGTVTAVGPDEFSVDTGAQRVTVHTTSLQRGAKARIAKGDVIRVTGALGPEFLRTREMTATSVMILRTDRPHAGSAPESGSEAKAATGGG
jgi:hypothetical protein